MSPFLPLLFYVMGAISKESIRSNATQLAEKQPRVEPTNAALVNLVVPSTRPSSAFAPSSSSRVVVSFTDIME